MLQSLTSRTLKITACLSKTYGAYPIVHNSLRRQFFFSSVRPCSTITAAMAKEESCISERYNNIVKGNCDRDYRGLVLKNGLRVLLISDPKADRSGASMDVAVGHLMDPWDLPGVAHFCEHMLFLGTEKFPDENAYGSFITSNGGMTNAFTATDHTNYHFHIKPEELKGGLDRFVQFFLKPKFTESATEREVCAVDSEHSNNLKTDAWRTLQIERSLSKPGHDYGKFGTGTKKTLLEDPLARNIQARDVLLDFHKTWYSSNIMGCAIFGKESLDELENFVEILNFGDIENKNVNVKRWNEHPYGPEQLKKRVEIVPVKDMKLLHVSFPSPYLQNEYKSKPARYYDHLLGHEGNGSLFRELQHRGWITSLYAGTEELARGMSNFSIKMLLSNEGEKHVTDILELLFNYIALLKQEGSQEWIHEELRNMHSIQFMFREKETADSVVSYSHNVQEIPFEDIVSHKYLIEDFRPDLSEKLLNCLTPDNMIYYVTSKSFEGQEGNTKEPIYGTPMKLTDINEEELQRYRSAASELHPALHLPEKNSYIPTVFDLKPREGESVHPALVYDDNWTRIWFMQDNEFKLPKIASSISLVLPNIGRSCRNGVLGSLFFSCFNNAMKENLYNASIAGLTVDDFNVTASEVRADLHISGYDEKYPIFMEYILEQLINYKPDPIRCQVIIDTFIRGLESFPNSQPYQLANHYQELILTDIGWSIEQVLSEARKATIEDVVKFGEKIFESFHLELHTHGNSSRDDIIELGKKLSKMIIDKKGSRPVYKNEAICSRQHSLDTGSVAYRHFQSTHSTSCVFAHYQIGVNNTRDAALTKLFVQLIKESAFVQLRTNEQLGYIVHTGVSERAGVLSFDMIVQGPKEPDFVLERMDSYLAGARDIIANMSDEDFNRHVHSLISNILKKSKTLFKEFSRLHNQIRKRKYDFDNKISSSEAVRSLTKEDVLDFFDTKLAGKAPEKKKLAILIHSKDDTKETFEENRKKRSTEDQEKEPLIEITSREEFKSLLPLYGMVKPRLDIPHIGID